MAFAAHRQALNELEDSVLYERIDDWKIGMPSA